MTIRPILKEILLSPAVGALILPMAFFVLLDWSWTTDSFWRPYGERGKSYESWETANPRFKVRATAYHESGVYLPGAYLAFQSSPLGANEWKEFAVFHVGDAIPIPRERFRFVNEQVAYVYMSDGYFVTTDGGAHWSAWKPSLPPPIGQGAYWAIKELDVNPDGTGVAHLQRYDEQTKDIVTLKVHTEDFGSHWSAGQSTAKPRKLTLIDSFLQNKPVNN